jgi:hypothetical protein
LIVLPAIEVVLVPTSYSSALVLYPTLASVKDQRLLTSLTYSPSGRKQLPAFWSIAG